MAWVKLDDQFFAHPKVVELGKDAKLLYLAGLTYCSSQLTDGNISSGAVRIVASLAGVSVKAVNELLEAGLWERLERGYAVHDYLDYQPSAERIKRNRASNASRQDAFRERRNGVTDDVSNGVTDDVSNGVTNSPRARVHSRPINQSQSQVPDFGLGAGAPTTAKAKRQPSKTPPPDAIEPNEADYAAGKAVGLSAFQVDDKASAMLDHFRAKGESRADWHATLRTWIRNSEKFDQRPPEAAAASRNGTGPHRGPGWAGANPETPPVEYEDY